MPKGEYALVNATIQFIHLPASGYPLSLANTDATVTKRYLSDENVWLLNSRVWKIIVIGEAERILVRFKVN